MITAFYSDPHFGHKNIIKYCNRPFAHVDEMTEELIKRYNDVISGPNDTVLWLGDCGFCKTDMFRNILARMHGRKILVIGNHDRDKSTMADLGFDLVTDECFLSVNGQKCRVKHFPYAYADPFTDPAKDKYSTLRPPRIQGEVLIHGHTHSPEPLQDNMVHVGVDAWNYAPVGWDTVAELVAKAAQHKWKPIRYYANTNKDNS